jgi:hypothetical protein
MPILAETIQKKKTTKKKKQVQRPGWEAQFARLVAYKEVHGDCHVPHLWAEDPHCPDLAGV